MNIFGPDVDAEKAAYSHPSAYVHGNVSLGRDVSMWAHSVIRAEAHEVIIGEETNIQDFVMIHCGYQLGVKVGSHTSIAHRATIHGATIGDDCLIGIGAVIMDGCEVGDRSIIGSGAVLLEGTNVPADSIVVGSPARVIKSRNNWFDNRLNANLYVRNAHAYARGDYRTWNGPEYDQYLEAEIERLRAEFQQRFPE